MIRKMDESGAMGWKVVEAKDHAEAFAMVESGKADAFVMDDVLLFGLRGGYMVELGERHETTYGRAAG